MTIEFTKGLKYQLTKPWVWKLRGNFHVLNFYNGRYYYLKKLGNHWYIGAHVGCGWDGATLYPDYDYMKEPSLGHDIILWLIAKGCIAEEDNNLADIELFHLVLGCNPNFKYGKIILRSFAWKVRLGTHLANTKLGDNKKIYRLPK